MNNCFPNYEKFYVIKSNDEDSPIDNNINSIAKANIESAVDVYLKVNNELINNHLQLCNNYIGNVMEKNKQVGEEINRMINDLEEK